jgi:hypothetical protein
MCRDLTELCAREFEAYVDRLAAAHERGRIVVSSSVCRELPVALENVPKLKHLNRAGLRARDWFRRWGPCWGQPLPLNEHERENWFCSSYFHLHLVALYSESLQARDFDYLEHPMFYPYARGIMAARIGEPGLWDDEELQKEFPAKKLPGLDAQGRWCPLPNRASKILELEWSRSHQLISQ